MEFLRSNIGIQQHHQSNQLLTTSQSSSLTKDVEEGSLELAIYFFQCIKMSTPQPSLVREMEESFDNAQIGSLSRTSSEYSNHTTDRIKN